MAVQPLWIARPTLPLLVWKDSSVAPQANSILSKRNWRRSLSSVLPMTPLLHSIQVLPSLFTVVFPFFLSMISPPAGDEYGPPGLGRPDAFYHAQKNTPRYDLERADDALSKTSNS
jgi:hypothetical protein